MAPDPSSYAGQEHVGRKWPFVPQHNYEHGPKACYHRLGLESILKRIILHKTQITIYILRTLQNRTTAEKFFGQAKKTKSWKSKVDKLLIRHEMTEFVL